MENFNTIFSEALSFKPTYKKDVASKIGFDSVQMLTFTFLVRSGFVSSQ